MDIRFCGECGKKTDHKEKMMQKRSKYGTSKMEKFKEFLDGFFSSPAASIPGGIFLELTDRYVICQECGKKTLENCGNEFQ